MAKKQTRRTVSINRDVYIAAPAHSATVGRPLSQLVEDQLLAIIGDAALTGRMAQHRATPAGNKEPIELPPSTPPQREPSRSEQAARHRIITGCTLQAAADMFGLTREAVRQYEARLNGNLPERVPAPVIRRPTEEDRVDCSGLFRGVGRKADPYCKSRRAAAAVLQGMAPAEAVRTFGVARSAVDKYVKQLRAEAQ